MEASQLHQWWEKSGRFGLIGVGLGLVILGGLWMFSEFENEGSDVQFFEAEEGTEAADKLTPDLVIDVRGAVNRPGVYELKSDSRLHQVVAAAGGFSDEADADWVEKKLNMARKLIDGEKVYIPTREEVAENFQEEHLRGVSLSDSSDGVLGESQQFININTATQAELETLPGIGPSFAQRIIDYRNQNSGFKSVEEIQAVSGIGEKTFEKIKNQISI